MASQILKSVKNFKAAASLGALFLVAAGLGIGCGGTSSQSEIGGSKAKAPIKKGGHVTLVAKGDILTLDPGRTDYQYDALILSAVHSRLIGYKPGSLKPVPELAASLPQISADRKTITVKIRPNVRYAPPVNRAVVSKDVKYAIERAFSSRVGCSYAKPYFGDIVGAPADPTPGIPSIRGIKTPDDQTVVFELKRPTAGLVVAALAREISVPVPPEYARKFDNHAPSQYERYTAFSGAYMIKNDPRTGRVTGYRPNVSIELVRNPNWNPEGDYREANFDSITVNEGNDLALAGRRTLQGKGLMCCDGQPPVAVMAEARQRYPKQIDRIASGGLRWIALNTSVAPTNNLNVRKALAAVTNRVTLRQLRGGPAVGVVPRHFIPAGIPGFKESGGNDGFPDLDFMNHPEGNMELARKYMLMARAEGVPVTPDGKYAGKQVIATYIGPELDATVGTAVQAEFAKLGFKLKVVSVPKNTLYGKFYGNPKNKLAVMPSVGWIKDAFRAESSLWPTFHGDAILQAGNVNWSMLNVASINDKMNKARGLADGPESDKAWAEINHDITAQAPGIPYLGDDTIALTSSDVVGKLNPYNAMWDLNFSGFKAGASR